jgi:hypothetical protein
MRIIAIDPGVGGTGYAIFDNGILVKFGTVKAIGNEWLYKCSNILFLLDGQINGFYQVEKVLIECPQFMSGSSGRMVAARGDLVKLTLLTGMILQKFMVKYGVSAIELVEPSKWKGQLPKSVCNNRVLKILKSKNNSLPLKFDDHGLDAVGIGLWKLGEF